MANSPESGPNFFQRWGRNIKENPLAATGLALAVGAMLHYEALLIETSYQSEEIVNSQGGSTKLVAEKLQQERIWDFVKDAGIAGGGLLLVVTQAVRNERRRIALE